MLKVGKTNLVTKFKRNARFKYKLLIYSDFYNRDDKRTEDTVELKARVLFFSISAKMKSIHQSSGVKGFVLIDHYSSATQSWERMEYYGDCYSKALAEVERIEDHMCNIPNIVDQTFYGDLPHVRFMLSPNVADTDNIDLYLELQNNINAIHVHLAEIQESKEFCNDSADDEDNFTRLLEELGNINIENCSWEFLESIKKRKK